MASLQENIYQAISDFDAVKNAIVENGVGVPHGTDTKEYGRLVNQACKSQYQVGKQEGLKEGEQIANRKPYLNTDLITDFTEFFMYDRRIDLLEKMSFSGASNFRRAFSEGSHDVVIGEPLDNCIDFEEMFVGNYLFSAYINMGLKSIKRNLKRMFASCMALNDVSGLCFTGTPSSRCSDMFFECYCLTRISFDGSIQIDSDTFSIVDCFMLEADCVADIANQLYNLDEETHTVYFGADNIAKLTPEQLSSVIDKNIELV